MSVVSTTPTPSEAGAPPHHHPRRRKQLCKNAIFSWLNLHSFSPEEIQAIAETIANNDNSSSTANMCDMITEKNMQIHVQKRIRKRRKPTSGGGGEHAHLTDDAMDRVVEQYAKEQAELIMEAITCTSEYSGTSEKVVANAAVAGENERKKRKFKYIISRQQFENQITDLASAIDYKKVLPISLSMLLVGSSVGIVSPVMPFIVEKLGLTSGEFGYVVSAFAAAKVAGNFPAAVLVDKHGRKPYLVYSLSLVAFGVGGIGLASCMEQLVLCRLITGFGVAALSTASTMMIADISTPLNRASTFAPIMSGFAAGTALGPAIGGIAADAIGIEETFMLVGGSYFALVAINHFLIQETKPDEFIFPWELSYENEKKEKPFFSSVKDAISQWKPLLDDKQVRNLVVMSGLYSMTLAGTQMTLLPIVLTDPSGTFGMSATSIGQVYMGMSIASVVSNPSVALVADKVGKSRVIIGGGTLMSLSIASMPFCSNISQLAAVMGCWTLGSTALSTAPVAHISDIVTPKQRAQAIALLRTSGDIGFFAGATSLGLVADITGNIDIAMQSGAGLLLSATSWYAMRQFIARKTNAEQLGH
eukprot:CAMPEP_0196809574 /NCGR_PEP_ID=MMETSP1362-20130617/9492_1 /TAXON_ID=163516 /ORGANISM="Leptocylindrus danicus, Strain CCMP1856" /LENGTH=588 /DNA_ID=CAMNT_0042184303 /DNA_START=184 /DNA_END=1950 /DNA_ORIENTATION=+